MRPIELRGSPASGGVAGCAIGAKLTGMRFWLRMAGSTGSAHPLELSIGMAALTGNRRVRAGQREIAEIVIEIRILPIRWVMASSAFCTILTLMGIIQMMTGIAVPGCSGKIYKAACIDVTLHTGHADMFSCELERQDIVVEGFPQPIHAIMAIETVRTKR